MPNNHSLKPFKYNSDITFGELARDAAVSGVIKQDYSDPQDFINFVDRAIKTFIDAAEALNVIKGELIELDENNAKMLLRSQREDISESLWVYSNDTPSLDFLLKLQIFITEGYKEDYLNKFAKAKIKYLRGKDDTNIS